MGGGQRSIILFSFPVVLAFVFVNAGQASNGGCSNIRCNISGSGPEIRFPFRLGSQPEHCGHPGMVLSCKGQHTTIHLPSLGEFYVVLIEYQYSWLLIEDPGGCLPGRFVSHTLNFSSPFYGYDHFMYTFINCSSPWPDRNPSCLSGSAENYYVYGLKALNSWVKMNDTYEYRDSCQIIGVSPFQEGPMSLYWNHSQKCRLCEQRSHHCRYKNIKASNETECYAPRAAPLWGAMMGRYNQTEASTSQCNQAKSIIIGVSVGSFIILLASITIIKVYNVWKADLRREKEDLLRIEKFLKDYDCLKPTRYSYTDIRRMAKHFKNKIGQGGYGSVFAGKLCNGSLVAVKVLEKSKGNGEEFINEVSTIGKIHHVNVVTLLGFCAEGSKRALVYEFMTNGSLEKFIFLGNSTSGLLSWEKLHKIAIGVAKGIEYLHQGCNQRILHFDIKPHNILLDDNFNPKISDFGMAKLCSKDESIVSMTAARGTMGYIAPELFSRNFGSVSYKSDVYSFGMLLLEMVGGRKNTDVNVENSSQVYFPDWIYNHLQQGDELETRTEFEGDSEMAKKLVIVGLWCIQWHSVDRPSMKKVVQMLEGDMQSLNIPPNPFPSDMPPTSGAAAASPEQMV